MPRRGSISSRSNFGSSSKKTSTRKRNRYVLHACDRCRDAKVRCNGAMPCSYCAPRNPDSCHYTPPRFPQEPSRDRQLGSEDVHLLATLIQQQNAKLDIMMNRISALEKLHQRHHMPPRPDSTSSWAEEPLPLFQSSTSAFFCIRIMDADLRASDHFAADQLTAEQTAMGDNNPATPATPKSFSILHGQIINEVVSDVGDGDPNHDPMTAPPSRTVLNGTENSEAQLLDHLNGAEIIRLIRQYQDFSGMMYPLVDVVYMEERVRDLWVGDSRNDIERGSSSQLSRDDLATLRLVVAIALTVENENGSALIQSLIDSLWPDIQSMIWNSRVDLKSLILLTLVCLYYYYSNKWRLAWRFVANVTRTILELGLNRQIVLDRSFPDRERHSKAVNTVWSVFVLEQQLSYGLGLSMAMHNLRIDHTFPRPVEAPYLEAMVQYSRIGGQACDSLLGERHAGQTVPLNYQDILSYFQYRLDDWQKAIETEFQFRSNEERVNQWNQRLRTIFYLRANNLRLAIARFLLLENGVQGTAPPDVWDSSVDVAADTIQVLASLDNSPTIGCFEKSQSNYFLVAALGMSLLAMSQNPTLPMSLTSPVKTRIPMAPATHLKAQQTAMLCLNLLHDRAESSRQSRCLWERIRGLASRLNLDFLIPIGTPVASAGDWDCAMAGPHDELLVGLAGLAGNQELAGLAPIMDMNFPALVAGAGDSTPVMDMVSGLNMAFDPAFLTSGFGE